MLIGCLKCTNKSTCTTCLPGYLLVGIVCKQKFIFSSNVVDGTAFITDF